MTKKREVIKTKTNNKPTEENLNVNKTVSTWLSIIKNAGQGAKWVMHAKFAELTKLISIAAILVTLFCIVWLTYNIGKDQATLNKVVKGIVMRGEEDEINMKIRDAVTPKINYELKKILYSSNASRAVIFELHNGKENATNLPFRYVDMSYEVINDNEKNVNYISDDFQNVPLTHYQIPYYVAEHQVFIGDVEDARLIDPRFAKTMESIGGQYVSGVILKSRGHNIGFLCLFYDKDVTKENKEGCKLALEKLSDIISPLLDLKLLKSGEIKEDYEW